MFIVCVISSKLALTPGVRAASGRRSISAIARLTADSPVTTRTSLSVAKRGARGAWAMASGPNSDARRISSRRCSRTGSSPASHRAVVLLGQPAHPLDHAAVDRAGVEEQDPPARRRLVLAPQAAVAGEVDVEIGAGARRRHQRQRRRPVLELARHPIDLVGGEVAGIEAHQQQRLQVDVLDADAGTARTCRRRRPAARAASRASARTRRARGTRATAPVSSARSGTAGTCRRGPCSAQAAPGPTAAPRASACCRRWDTRP